MRTLKIVIRALFVLGGVICTVLVAASMGLLAFIGFVVGVVVFSALWDWAFGDSP